MAIFANSHGSLINALSWSMLCTNTLSSSILISEASSIFAPVVSTSALFDGGNCCSTSCRMWPATLAPQPAHRMACFFSCRSVSASTRPSAISSEVDISGSWLYFFMKAVSIECFNDQTERPLKNKLLREAIAVLLAMLMSARACFCGT